MDWFKQHRSLIIFLACITALLILFTQFDLKSIKSKCLLNLWNNLALISKIIFFLAPLIIVIFIAYLIFSKRLVLRVERLSVSGFNILFDNPNQLFKRQMKNFLDTKRTLFVINPEHDNFSETLDSYFETYKFIREELRVLGNINPTANPTAKKNEKMRLYELANKMIQKLNQFLTHYQNDFRRWYKYQEKFNKEEFYLKPIGELQGNYRKNKELVKGFKEINKFFVEKVAQTFNIDIKKWSD